MLVTAEQARHIPHILTKSADHAYEHIKEKHGLSHSLEEFTRNHKKIRLGASIFLFSGLILVLVLTLAF